MSLKGFTIFEERGGELDGGQGG